MRTAFSRDQAEKIYVTNLLREDTDLVWQVIDNKGHVYICGYVSFKLNLKVISMNQSLLLILNVSLFFFLYWNNLHTEMLRTWLTMLEIYY